MNPPEQRRSLPLIVAQLVRYGAVGVSNTLIGFGVYALCLDLLAIHYEVSLAIAYVVGAINGYLLNRYWTFSAHDADHSTSGWRYAAVQVAAFLTNLVLLHIGTQVQAGELRLPANTTLHADAELLVVNVVAAPTEADLEAEIDTEGAGVVEEPSDEEQAAEAAAEGDSDASSSDS